MFTIIKRIVHYLQFLLLFKTKINKCDLTRSQEHQQIKCDI